MKHTKHIYLKPLVKMLELIITNNFFFHSMSIFVLVTFSLYLYII